MVSNGEPKLSPIRPRPSTSRVKRRGRAEERPRTCGSRGCGRGKNEDERGRGQGTGVAGGGAVGKQLDGVAGEPHGSLFLTTPPQVGKGETAWEVGGRRDAERRRRRRVEVTWEAAGCIGADSSTGWWGQLNCTADCWTGRME